MLQKMEKVKETKKQNAITVNKQLKFQSSQKMKLQLSYQLQFEP